MVGGYLFESRQLIALLNHFHFVLEARKKQGIVFINKWF
jgi:hypothetical protein